MAIVWLNQAGVYPLRISVSDDGSPPLSDTKTVPINASAKWAQTSGIEGGLIYSLLAAGGNLFAGAADGGVYRSTDRGQTWMPINRGLPPNITVYATGAGTG